MCEKKILEGHEIPKGVVADIQVSEQLETEPGGQKKASKKGTKKAVPTNPTVHVTREVGKRMSELEKAGSDSGNIDAEADKIADAEGEEAGGKAERPADVEQAKEDQVAEAGEKRQRPDDVEVQNGEEQGDIGTEAKKARVEPEQEEPEKKKRQVKKAKVKVQTAETTTKKRGPGRPRKTSDAKKKADSIDVEGNKEPEAMETAKTVN